MSEIIRQWQQRFEECVATEFEKQANDDGAHDISHLRRVWRHSQDINEQDGLNVEPLVLLAAAYFHDIVNLPKNSADRKQASRMAAEHAVTLLNSLTFPSEYLEEVKQAIESHSFSANLEAGTTAAKIIQDADRLEALGALGIARLFYVGGQMGSSLFDTKDPFANERELNDRQYAIDHFYVKLLKLADSMKTRAGQRKAEALNAVLHDFLEQLKTEIHPA